MVRRPFVPLLVLVVAAFCFASQVRADVIDPSTLHIGPGGTTGCATGGCPIFGTELNAIPDGTLDIFQQSGGASDLVSPVLLIFAVPNDATGTTLSAGSVGATATLEDSSATILGTPSVTFGVIPSATQFGATGTGLTFGTSGFQTFMTGSDVYSLLGIGDASNNSESFVNFQAGDVAVGGFATAPTDYGLYVFSIATGGFGSKDFLQLTLSGIPQGTFAMAYGQDAISTCERTRGGVCVKFSDYKAFTTPFTEAGVLTHKVPEPASLLILGSAMLGLGTLLRLKRRT